MGQSSRSKAYLIPGRLEDVLALIQVLAIDSAVRRTEKALIDELQGPPKSVGYEQWIEVAREHGEFFRVTDSQVSLLARHVVDRNADGQKKIPDAFVQTLFDTAVQLHDTQIRRRRAGWAIWTGVGGLLLSIAFSGANLLLTWKKVLPGLN